MPRRGKLLPIGLAAVLLTGAIWQPAAFAVDRVCVEAGAGHEGELIRLAVQWELEKRWFEQRRWRLGALIEAAAGAWSPELGDRGLYDVGATPVLRLAPNRPPSGRATPFFEAGVGAHLLSNVTFSDLDLSTSLQFGSHIGAGVLFGRGGRYSLTYRFQHLSNASIKQPNPGIEFHLLQIGFRVSAVR
jgi:lipid A 3-O-deacylase